MEYINSNSDMKKVLNVYSFEWVNPCADYEYGTCLVAAASKAAALKFVHNTYTDDLYWQFDECIRGLKYTGKEKILHYNKYPD